MTKLEIYLQIREVLCQALNFEENKTVLFGDTEYGYYYSAITPDGEILINVDKQSGHVFTKYKGHDEIYNYSGVTLKFNVSYEKILVH